MTKRMNSWLMAAAIGVLAAGALGAADAVTVKARVPFDFVVGDQRVPAGEYRFVKGAAWGIVQVYSDQLAAPLVVLCLQTPTEREAPGVLMFHKYGHQHFLSSIQVGAVNFGASFHESRAEREWRRFGSLAAVRVMLP